MPNESLARAFETSAQGFQSKLSAVMGTVQNIQASQQAKQQMRQELENRKELVQFQSDVQFDTRKRIYEEIQQPQQEAERLQRLQEQMTESFKTANEEADNLRQEHLNSRFNQSHGLLSNYNFRPAQDPETGVYSTEVIRYNPQDGNTQTVPFEQYQREAHKAEVVSSYFNEMEQKIDQLGEGDEEIQMTETGDRVVQVTRDTLPRLIRDAQRDPQTLDVLYEQIQSRKVTPVYEEDTIEDRDADIVGALVNLRTGLGQTNEFQFADGQTFTYNRGQEVQQNVMDIENFLRDSLDIDIDLLKMNPEAIQAAMNRSVNRDSVPDRSARRAASRLEDVVENNPDNINWLMTYYMQVPQWLQTYNNQYIPDGKETLGMENAVLNLDTTPSTMNKLFQRPNRSLQELHNRYNR